MEIDEKHYIFDEELAEDQLLKLETDLSEAQLLQRKEEAKFLKEKGNHHFQSKEFEDSIRIYTLALNTCPLKNKQDRSILFANRAAAKIKLNCKNSAVEDCTKAIELDCTYVKTYLRYMSVLIFYVNLLWIQTFIFTRRATLYEELNKIDESLSDHQCILKLDKNNRFALEGKERLTIKVNERNEKMKDEAVGHLKTLGNLVLKPFGLSTDNFQMQPNGEGGYSINFVQNQNTM